jgi:hypothetical protein
MTTFAFFGNWPTNVDNSYRVTTNQTLIVALGRSFNASAANVGDQLVSEDAHAKPGTTCYACHKDLDPMRDLFRRSYSASYFKQLLTPDDPFTPIPKAGSFSFLGSPPVVGSGVVELANAIAAHPRFAISWVNKLCLVANNRECDEDDPEAQRIAGAFRDSGYDFRVLVREVFSSPLTTFAERTKTTVENGGFAGICRREHFCARLEYRLGIPDLCNERGESVLTEDDASRARNFALGIPGTTYARGDDHPVAPSDPNLFFVSSAERLCTLVAPLVVEAGASSRWSVAKKEAALADFVGGLMGLAPSDPRSPAVSDLLRRHYDAALATGASDVDALRSTFVTACESPLGISSGL